MQFNIFPSFVQTVVQSGDKIQNTASTTAFATNYLVIADEMIPGLMYQISASGDYGTPNTPNDREFTNLILSVGGTAIVTVSLKTPNGINIIAGASWSMIGNLICVLNGTSGKIDGSAAWIFEDSSLTGSNDQVWSGNTNIQPVTLDTTVDNLIELKVTYTTALIKNYIQMRHLVIYVGV